MTLTAWYAPAARQDLYECTEYFESRDDSVADRFREEGFVGSEEKIWTQHGSTKYVFDEKGLQTVCRYVAEQKPEQ